MFGLVISFQGNMIMVYYPEISSYLKEVENLRTCKNMKTTCDNLCNYGRDCENIYFALYGIVQEDIESVMDNIIRGMYTKYIYEKVKRYITMCYIYDL